MGKTKKNFVMEASERVTIETMLREEVKKYLKGDGYDEMREKVWFEGITVSRFEEALPGIEVAIKKMIEKKNVTVPVTTFKPFLDRLCVFPDNDKEVVKNGLFIPNQFQQEKPSKGTVVAVGPGKGSPLPLSVGMKIYFGKYAGTPIPASEEDPREILIMRYDDTFGEIDKPKE